MNSSLLKVALLAHQLMLLSKSLIFNIAINISEVTDSNQLLLNIPAQKGNADLLMFLIDKEHSTKVPRGENAGETLINRNTVREIKKLSSWSGKELSLKIKKPKSEAAIFVLQKARQSEVIGLKYLEL